MIRHCSSFVLACALVAPLARGDVHTVGGIAPDFATIQAAVDAASDGDVVLVRSTPGYHLGFTVSAKSLAIFADPPSAWHRIGSTVTVQNLARHQSVVIAGLRIEPYAVPAIVGHSLEGALRCQDVVATGGRWGQPAVRLTSCSDVVLADCDLRGGDWPLSGYFARGGDALQATGSNVALYASVLRGGPGSNGNWAEGDAPGGDGGNGVTAAGSFVFASASSLFGGTGGWGGGVWPCVQDFPGGDGGHGLVVSNGDVPARVLECALAGGPGGTGTACSPPASLNGAPGSPQIGPFELVPGTSRLLRSLSPIREGQSVPIVVRGVPGERVVLFVGERDDFVSSPALAGVVHLGSPVLRRLPIGTIGASGQLAASLIVPELGPGVEERERKLQALVIDAAGTPRLTGATTVVMIDAGL